MAVRIFIGSPFRKLQGLRRSLHSALSMAGHVPWCWEIDGESQQGGEVFRISNAIKSSDFVVTLFDSKPGSILSGTSYYYTEFEWLLARTLGKPIHLYMKRGHQAPPLQRLALVLTSVLPLPDSSAQFDTDNEAIADVLGKAANFGNQPEIAVAGGDLKSLITDPRYIEQEFNALTRSAAERDYISGGHRAVTIPLVNARLPSRDRAMEYAQLLTLSANLAVNTARYKYAISAAKLCVNVLINAGFDYETLSAIQALSGILNMAGLRREAKAWNAYGIERSTSVRALHQAYWDSRGSILRKAGHLYLAKKYFRDALLADQTEDAHAYLAARLAGTLSSTEDLRETAEAVTLIDSVLGRVDQFRDPMTSAIVHREGAYVALAIGDTIKAKECLRAAKRICEQHGYVHTSATLDILGNQAGM